MNKKNIAVLPGDGIGPEVVTEAIKILNTIADIKKYDLTLVYGDVGGSALEKFDDPLPQATVKICKESDAVILGAIGDPKWDNMPADKRPERGLLGVREQLGLYANLRPAKVYNSLIDASTLKKEVVENIDILIVRELTGGIYFGEPREIQTDQAFNTMLYKKKEVVRIAHVAFQEAQKRQKKVMSVDKANVLHVSQFWRKLVTEIAQEYPDVALDHMYVDNAAMQLIRNPRQFDVILTGNMFGDILSDEASMLTGSLGMLPSASIGTKSALFEPVHGSAPDIAGQGKANPIATIASISMMLRHTFNDNAAADAIETAIEEVLAAGYRTADISSDNTNILSTKEMGDKINQMVTKILS